MIGKTFQDYIKIRLAILGFRAVAPASIIYLATSIVKGKQFGSIWFVSYALVEATFYLLVYILRHRRLQKVKSVKHSQLCIDIDIV